VRLGKTHAKQNEHLQGSTTLSLGKQLGIDVMDCEVAKAKK
jgi:hypothetical protein